MNRRILVEVDLVEGGDYTLLDLLSDLAAMLETNQKKDWIIDYGVAIIPEVKFVKEMATVIRNTEEKAQK